MLFLAGGAHNVLDQVTGARPLAKQSIEAFQANHIGRRRFSEQYNFKFVHVLTPDKQSFLGDLWPFDDRPFVRLGYTLLQHLGSDSEDIDYPVDVLAGIGRAAASPVDTHYTDHGAIVIAARTAGLLTGEPQDALLQHVLDGLTGSRTHAGDLGSKLVPVRKAIDITYAPPLPGQLVSNELKFGNNGIVDIWINPSARYSKRLAVIGDSFGRHIARFLQIFFREIVYLRSQHFHVELIEAYRPHFVVTQNVERYVGNITPDHWRTHFLLLPYAKGHAFTPPAEYAETLSALLAVGRRPYERFVGTRFGTAPDI